MRKLKAGFEFLELPRSNFVLFAYPRELVEKAIQQLEGAFACCFKSKAFPGELVATRRGSPLLVAIKSQGELNADYIPIQYR